MHHGQGRCGVLAQLTVAAGSTTSHESHKLLTITSGRLERRRKDTLMEVTPRPMAILVAAALLLLRPVPFDAAAAVKLTAANSDKYGTYVADGEGRALYMFTTDTQKRGSTAAQSTCYDACAAAWPPVLVDDGTPEVGDKLKQDLLGTFVRKDGKTQVTYGGWPLYYYVRDKGPGAVTGQDVHGFGGEWYLVRPDGAKLESGK